MVYIELMIVIQSCTPLLSTRTCREIIYEPRVYEACSEPRASPLCGLGFRFISGLLKFVDLGLSVEGFLSEPLPVWELILLFRAGTMILTTHHVEGESLV